MFFSRQKYLFSDFFILIQNFPSTCSTESSKKSLQSTFYNHLKQMQLMEIKVYFILNTAHHILNYHEPENLSKTFNNNSQFFLKFFTRFENILFYSHSRVFIK